MYVWVYSELDSASTNGFSPRYEEERMIRNQQEKSGCMNYEK